MILNVSRLYTIFNIDHKLANIGSPIKLFPAASKTEGCTITVLPVFIYLELESEDED
jgi:hypothetical protein